MSRFRLLAVLLTLCMTAGCKAQTTPLQTALDPATINRRIEVRVRSEFNIPQDYNVTIGARKPSQIPGYDSLSLILSRGAKSQVIEFLISADGSTLARLEKFDLAKDDIRMQGVIMNIDPVNGKANSIERVSIKLKD